MKILKILLVFFAFYTQVVFAQSYISQLDPFFITNKMISSKDDSSLCGPASFMNWLISENKINANGARELLKSMNRNENINHGYTSDQLIGFIEKAENKISIRNFYESNSNLEVEDLLKKEPQILLLKFNQLQRRTYRQRNSYDDAPPMDDSSSQSIIHYVFKVASNNGQIELIDPMQPNAKIILGIKKEAGKILLNEDHYRYFGYASTLGVHEVQVIEAISKRE